MASDLELIETDDYAQWDAFVELSPQGTIFSHSKYLQSLNVPFRLYKILSGQKVVALLPAIEDKSRRKIVQYDFTPNQGILFVDDARIKLAPRQKVVDEFRITEFLIHELTQRYDEIAMFLSWAFQDVRPFLWHNYHQPHLGQFSVKPRYTALLDLKKIDPSSYLGELRKGRRWDVKKAADCIVREASNLNAFMEIYESTFSRQGIALNDATLSLVRGIATSAISQGYGRLSSCEAEDGIASMNLLLYDKRRAYYLFGANNPNLRDTGGGTKLLFHNILEAKARGLEEFDFVGVNSPNRGDFKLGFNAELALYFDVRYSRPPIHIDASH